MNVRIGSCPDSWGVWFAEDPRQIPWSRFLGRGSGSRIRMDSNSVPTVICLPTSIGSVRRSKIGPEVSATFLFGHLEDPEDWPRLERQLLGAGELLAALGAEYVVLIDDLHTDWFTGERLRPKFSMTTNGSS